MENQEQKDSTVQKDSNLSQPEASITQPYNQQPKKSKTWLYILVVFLGIILLCVGAYFFFDYKIKEKNLQENEQYNEERANAINNVFSVAQYDNIPQNYREFIYNFLEYNNFLDGTYFLTKISDRAKSVYAFGDFTSDDNDEDDLAVLFENNDYKSSKLVIFNHKGEGLYINDYNNELPVINAFKVGSKIYMNDTKLVPAPCGGIIVKTDYNKYALVYDKKAKKFNSYYQYSDEEIKSMNEEGSYYEEEGDPGAEPIDDTPEEGRSIINSINEDSN